MMIRLLLVTGFIFTLGLANDALAKIQFKSIPLAENLNVLLVSGSFENIDQTAEFVNAVQTYLPVAITFNSGGGNVASAMKLGRTIRHLKLITFQKRSAQCASACSLAFLGGVERLAEAGSIGVHQGSFANFDNIDKDSAVSNIQYMTAITIGYFNEMGVDPKLLEISLKYGSDDIHYLSSSEMRELRVTTGSFSSESEKLAKSNNHQRKNEVANAPSEQELPVTTLLDIPRVRSGLIRHPKGSVLLLSKPNQKKGIAIETLQNGTPVEIVGDNGRWYKAKTKHNIGYIHHTWLKVDQFEDFGFNKKIIQIKSFKTFAEAKSYVSQTDNLLSAHLASNGWFAITFNDTFDPDIAVSMIKRLKKEKLIPEDSYITYGNTYVRKICCQ